ncbi:MAG: hypothetical protein DMG97_04940 [Acidobacteria bacterium]|nr:MAG: hypothetical protein DMG97_04940 [Acidobacteriota bacterium]
MENLFRIVAPPCDCIGVAQRSDRIQIAAIRELNRFLIFSFGKQARLLCRYSCPHLITIT